MGRSVLKQELEGAGMKVLSASRAELYIEMRFMAAALSSLGYEMDLSTTSLGTDAVNIRFNPSFVLRLFLEEPGKLNRTYIHMLLHCIFRHMYTSKKYRDERLFDLSADIVVESILDGMDYRCIYRISSDYRDRWYQKLEKELKVLTVEKIYNFFSEKEILEDEYEYEKLEREFKLDDHGFWKRLPEDEPENENEEKKEKLISPMILKQIEDKEKDWDKEAKRLQTELETIGKKQSDRLGKLSWILKFQNTKRTDYREFLGRFKILREEGGIDMDSFDYGMYSFGLEMYKDMPLIEENEFREVKKIQELVIAIDTSASCKDELVQRFLDESAAILLDGDNFFQQVRIYIIECDDQVQRIEKITRMEDMKKYSEGIHVEGGFGTDFRPVFEKVEELKSEKAFDNLKGLIYFTDGYGTYPEKPTDYDTAFVFPEDGDIDDEKAPDWALKLYI